MEIACEMQVDLVHRRDLRAPASGRAPLLAKAGAERRLAQADRRAHTDPRQTVAEPDRCGGLALAGGRRVDRGDENQLALRPPLQGGEEIGVDLGDRAPLQLQRGLGNRQLGGDFRDGRKPIFARNFNIRFQWDAPEVRRSTRAWLRKMPSRAVVWQLRNRRRCSRARRARPARSTLSGWRGVAEASRSAMASSARRWRVAPVRAPP